MSQSKSLETLYYFKGNEFILKASGSIQVFDGFRKIYNFNITKKNLESDLEKGQELDVNEIRIKQNLPNLLIDIQKQD